jgi:large subunit ribosomal protein L30
MAKNTSDKTVTIEQYRSGAGRTKEVKTTLTALGLGRIGKKKTLPHNAAVEGMIKRVAHLVRVI